MDRKEYKKKYQQEYRKKLKRLSPTISLDQAKKLEALAKERGTTVPAMLRQYIIDDINQDPNIAIEAVKELKALNAVVSAIGNNINQIAHKVNIEKMATNEDEEKLLEELRKLEEATKKYTTGEFKNGG